LLPPIERPFMRILRLSIFTLALAAAFTLVF
jgi:hypothetical protein